MYPFSWVWAPEGWAPWSLSRHCPCFDVFRADMLIVCALQVLRDWQVRRYSLHCAARRSEMWPCCIAHTKCTPFHSSSEHRATKVCNLLQVTLLAPLPIYARVFPSGLSPSRFPTKILFASPSVLPVLATWPLIWSPWWYLLKSVNDGFRKWGGGHGLDWSGSG
jgi:hypothetical protein